MLLVVWEDDALHLESRASHIIAGLTRMVWAQATNPNKESQNSGKEVETSESKDDIESDDVQSGQRRGTKLINSILVAMTLCLIVIMLGAGWRELGIECAVDHHYARLCLILLAPVQMFFTLVIYLRFPLGVSSDPITVLCTSHHWVLLSALRDNPANEAEFSFLLCQDFPTPETSRSTPCHHPVPGL